MIKKLLFPCFMLMFLVITGCVKETYNMNKLSDKMHFSPSLAMMAATGDISFSDMVKPSDTVVFDQNNFVKVIFKKDSVINLKLSDFYPAKKSIGLNGIDETQQDLDFSNQEADATKGAPGDLIAALVPDTLDLKIEDVLSKMTGTFSVLNPSIIVTYTNSFSYPINLNLIVKGKRKASTLNLNLSPFTIIPTGPTGTASFKIDSTNSALPAILSMPPEKIFFSGTAMVNLTGKNSQIVPYVLGSNRFVGAIEIQVPLEFRMKNLQFADTVDNFLKSKNNDNNSFKAEDMDSLQVRIVANNGFPLGVSISMMLFDPVKPAVIKTIVADSLLLPAQVGTNGRTTKTESTTTIRFNKDFFDAVNSADKIIFKFEMNTSGNGNKNVKIYSDYSISFKASLVVKPNLNL